MASPDLTKDRAKEIARNCGQPAEDFEGYPVSKDVGNVRNKGEYLIKSITSKDGRVVKGFLKAGMLCVGLAGSLQAVAADGEWYYTNFAPSDWLI